MKYKNILQPVSALLTLILTISIITGCAEQPVGYSYETRQRDHSVLARTTLEVINGIYNLTDKSTAFLENASFTNDYGTILPVGWQKLVGFDTLANENFIHYRHNFLDQNYADLRFDPIVDTDAIRTPSSLRYRTAEVKSYQNNITNEFYLDISNILFQEIEYADNRQNHRLVDGWAYYSKLVQVQEELEVAGGQTITYTINLLARWYIKIENFSLSQRDQSSRLTFTGVMPVVSEADEYLENQISGEITIDKDGKGYGEMNYYGRPSIKIYLTGRSYSFQGYYTIADEDYKKRYRLELR